jgi:hypothetical protein
VGHEGLTQQSAERLEKYTVSKSPSQQSRLVIVVPPLALAEALHQSVLRDIQGDFRVGSTEQHAVWRYRLGEIEAPRSGGLALKDEGVGLSE